MESIGIYWMPIYEILEDAFSGDITLLVVNARHMKTVPGKKTDTIMVFRMDLRPAARRAFEWQLHSRKKCSCTVKKQATENKR